jgi:cytochrome c
MSNKSATKSEAFGLGAPGPEQSPCSWRSIAGADGSFAPEMPMTRMVTRACSGVVLALLSCPAVAQDTGPKGADAGQLLFNNACRTCHAIKEGDNRLGPSLHGVIGRKAGSLPGFGFSESMKRADVVWDDATLDRFIANPDAVVPGNNMKPFGGLASAEERARIVAFLRASNSR